MTADTFGRQNGNVTQVPSSGSEIHRHRDVAESFGSDPERYDRARPSYPDALVERVIATSSGLDLLDVGCGTGIAARLFQAVGCQVLGVDPDARMADLARQRGIEVEVAKFEDWNPTARVFDTIIAAQAWHWVDPVVGAVKAAQALRPGGRLAVFWNSYLAPADLTEAFAEVYRRVQTDLPFNSWASPALDGYLTMCDMAAEGMRQTDVFGEHEQWRFEWERPYTQDEWLDQVPTTGGHSQIPSPRLEELLAGIGAAIDAVGGRFTMNYTTVVATAATDDAA
jgi:SAM-dependent methyltransferase